MDALKILPACGEGDREAVEGALALRQRMEAHPLRQTLRACHLPTSGEDLA
jgi:hypothetical protein